MQLPTANHRTVTYPDRLAEGLTWIEYVSRADVLGHDVLADEVESLAAAGLLVQHELGAPVVKLLNITNLVFTPESEPDEVRRVDRDLNLLGLLVSDGARYRPEAALKGALSRASSAAQAHFTEVPRSLSQILRFMDAVGAGGKFYEIQLPWIHLTIDRPARTADDGDQLSLAHQWPIPMSQALWWLDDIDAESLLFRVQSGSRAMVGDQGNEVHVPLPVSRSHEPVAGHDDRCAIRSTAGDRPTVGFRLTPTGDENDSILIDATWEYIDRNAP